jgi:putative ABC transport system ATP-binding protein
MAILELEKISYSYGKVSVLSQVDYKFETGKIYAITGRSGAGKTTLLSLLSGLTNPTDGKILYNGNDISKADKYKYRSSDVGVVFQSFNLLTNLTSLENVILSMDISGQKFQDKKQIALDLLHKVGLVDEEINRKVLQLSGGQQQRVAIARALSYNPKIILADEPTGNLDLETQDEIMDIFKMLAHQEDRCIIIVTHSPDVAKESDEVYQLQPLRRNKKQAG